MREKDCVFLDNLGEFQETNKKINVTTLVRQDYQGGNESLTTLVIQGYQGGNEHICVQKKRKKMTEKKKEERTCGVNVAGK